MLQHEQGHFNLGVLCARELLHAIQNASYTRNIVEEVTNTATTVIKKYKDLEVKYDTETGHSHNKMYQKKWNDYFKATLHN